MDAIQLGNRLRTVRERRGLSQQAVAAAIGLPRTAVTNIESGGRRVSTLELTKLAEVYGCSAAVFLPANAEPEEERLAIALHRTLPEMKEVREVGTEVRRLIDLCCEGAVLRQMLKQTIGQMLPDRAMPMRNVGDAIRQGEAVAREERRRLGLGDAPVRNVAGLISDQGIWTAAIGLPDGLSGLFVNHPVVGSVVLVNRRHRYVRRRFSWLHEFAHALFDREETMMATRRENSSERAEKRANAFAAAFLMPPGGVAEQLSGIDKGRPSRLAQIVYDVAGDSAVEAEVRARPGSQAITYQDVAILARHFGVSYEAAVWRLRNLDHVGADEAAALVGRKDVGNKYIRFLGFHELLGEGGASDAPERELRSQLTRLAIEAFRQGEISRGRLVEIGGKLSMDGDVLLELAEAVCPDR